MTTADGTEFVPWLATPDQLRELLQIPYSDEQMAAIVAPLDQAQSIIAGAGSGKTAVMAARVVWLVGHLGVSPERILGLTFTTKAAAELASRVRFSLDRAGVVLDEGEPAVSTYHAFANEMLREHGVRLGIEPDRQLLTEARRATLAAATVRRHRGSLEHVSTHVPTTAKDLLSLDGQLSEHLVTTEELRLEDEALRKDAEQQLDVVTTKGEAGTLRSLLDTIEKRKELSFLVDEYRAAKTLANVMDFSDQMAWGAQLADDPEVAELVRERFDVVLLDEYQDTSIAQRNLLQSLFRGRSVSAVGDPAQSIYGWRGAASGNLLNFLADFTAEGERVPDHHSLSVTRRCAPQIIDLAGVVAASYYNSDEARGVVTPLRAADGVPDGRVTAALHETVAEEVEETVRWIVAEHATGVPWAQIAVLVRNGRENDELVRALRKSKVPVEIVGLSGLLAQPEIRDVLSVLAILDDVTANPELLRLLLGPRWRVGERDLVLLSRRARQLSRVEMDEENVDPEDHEAHLSSMLREATAGVDPIENISLLEAVEDPGSDEPWAYGDGARERFADLTALFGRLRRHVHEPLPDLVRHVIRELDLDVEMAVADLPGDNLSLFLDAVSEFAREEPHASLAGLLVHLDAEEEHNKGMEVASPTDTDSVKVMTMHKAKGLEFASVVLPFVSKDVFPPKKGRESWLTHGQVLPHSLRGDAEQLPQLVDLTKTGFKEFKEELRLATRMEETRLAYVAMTRAETRLHVTGHHWGRTQKDPRGPSVFLTAVHDWLVSCGQAPELWAPTPEKDQVNPHLVDRDVAWPPTISVADTRRELARSVLSSRIEDVPEPPSAELEDLRREVAALVAEAQELDSGEVEVRRPAVLSATALMALAGDGTAFAEQTARPMPRRPVAAARFGTRFHAWVEGLYGQLGLFDPDETPGRGDVEVDDDADLEQLKQAFRNSEWAEREPVAVEQDFVVQLSGQTVVGQIDAVFRSENGGWIVVDWKTNRKPDADPLQLQIYRHAWAELQGVDPESVAAAFFYVRLGRTVHLDELLGREALENWIGLA